MNVPWTERQMRNVGEGSLQLLSVGHSNHNWPAFVALLRGAGVAAVADVRSSPYSRRHPYFNKGALEDGLREGVAHLGCKPGTAAFAKHDPVEPGMPGEMLKEG